MTDPKPAPRPTDLGPASCPAGCDCEVCDQEAHEQAADLDLADSLAWDAPLDCEMG